MSYLPINYRTPKERVFTPFGNRDSQYSEFPQRIPLKGKSPLQKKLGPPGNPSFTPVTPLKKIGGPVEGGNTPRATVS